MAGIALGVLIAAAASAYYLGIRLADNFEPFLREQAVIYLESRFRSDVELKSLNITMPRLRPFDVLVRGARGARAAVQGEGLQLRYRDQPGLPPLLTVRRFDFEIDLGTLADPVRHVSLVRLQGMRLSVPPREKRPALSDSQPRGPSSVLLERIEIRDAQLVVLPRDEDKNPLEFAIAQVTLESKGHEAGMRFAAILDNPRPPGRIDAIGEFGPWDADEPGDTPLRGDYRFANADLSVFRGIAGRLNSTGAFSGTLAAIEARGEAQVPDFRLKRGGAPVPLSVQFAVLVDGTSGNTQLRPVHARLGSTRFVTSGAVVKHEKRGRRSVRLNVDMPAGEVSDVLSLALKDGPIMQGRLRLKTFIDIPPLSGKISEKLRLAGSFSIDDGRFLKARIQEQIDTLSRRGQGKPGNQEIEDVVSGMRGTFRMEDEVIYFRELAFQVPGAAVALRGGYDLDRDALDFRGTLRLAARVSQTMTGWKRWVLKPVDPFFAKDGAGTQLRIAVEGSAKQPKFGRDKGREDRAAERGNE
ncbi:MAG: AsmA-like C-terminal region-containing protein [Bryobacteraceae bacterium]|nr:AsmA-like C-terminal region-containing protein [Bryobacteraceae bacterium]